MQKSLDGLPQGVKPPFGFLQSCPTLSPGFFVFRIHEAAARDLRQPAMTGRSRACKATLGMTGDEVELPSLVSKEAIESISPLS